MSARTKDSSRQDTPSPRDISSNSELEQKEIPEQDRNAYVAAGKSLHYLMKMENDGSVGLERDSVYGAAVAVPQIARSAGWPGTMLALAARSYFFLFLNILLQLFLLSTIGEDFSIMQTFSGQMHLCDFGAHLEECPNGPNCRGPGGTTMSYPRLYDFSSWSTRKFAHDALKGLFPGQVDDIDAAADPGEYGLEDYYARAACCFIFSMAVIQELNMTLSLLRLFWSLPTTDDKWIRFETPEWEADKDRAKQIFGWTELNLVKFGVAGMPWRWKALNVFVVFLPKLFLWVILVASGFRFLMETSGIVDVLMSSLAMTFILNLDELIFSVLTTVPVKYMMENLEEYELYSIMEAEAESEDVGLGRYTQEELGSRRMWRFLSVVVPRRLVLVVIVFLVFTWKYYNNNCVESEDGGWVSKPMYLPAEVEYNPIKFVFAAMEVKEIKPHR